MKRIGSDAYCTRCENCHQSERKKERKKESKKASKQATIFFSEASTAQQAFDRRMQVARCRSGSQRCDVATAGCKPQMTETSNLHGVLATNLVLSHREHMEGLKVRAPCCRTKLLSTWTFGPLIGARTLLVAPGSTARSKKLLVRKASASLLGAIMSTPQGLLSHWLLVCFVSWPLLHSCGSRISGDSSFSSSSAKKSAARHTSTLGILRRVLITRNLATLCAASNAAATRV